MVVLNRHLADDGDFFEIADFEEYVSLLTAKGIAPPPVKYRVYVSSDVKRRLDVDSSDWESQIARFYRLGDESGIEFQIRTDPRPLPPRKDS